MDGSDDLVMIQKTEDHFLAHLLRGALEARGISTHIAHSPLRAARRAKGHSTVWVSKEDVEAAERLIDEMAQVNPLSCPECEAPFRKLERGPARTRFERIICFFVGDRQSVPTRCTRCGHEWPARW